MSSIIHLHVKSIQNIQEIEEVPVFHKAELIKIELDGFSGWKTWNFM